jgi:pimeloyl-ACP methyl ester carboxylesterase
MVQLRTIIPQQVLPMLEMLNPSAVDVARFAASTLQFRLAFAAQRRTLPWASAAAKEKNRAAAATMLALRFCTPPESARRAPDLARLRHDTGKFFGWRSSEWREHEASIAAVIDNAATDDKTLLGERVRTYVWAPIGRKCGTMLLCHGWEGYALNFAMLITLARNAGFEVHAFDHLAHGASGGVKGGLPIALNTLRAIADSLGPIDVLVGHSLGGGAAAWAVANGAITAKRLVLLAPFFDTYYLTKLWAKAHLLDADALALLQHGLELDSGMTFADFMPPAIGAELSKPTLILHDPKDRMTRFKDSAALAKISPHVALEGIAGVGHVGLLADYAAMQRVVEFAKIRG